MPAAPRTLLLIGAVTMFLAVALGAFGAHGLKTRVEPNLLSVFETGVRYQAYHGLGILLIAVLSLQLSDNSLRTAAWLMLCGIVLFSGSLYMIVIFNLRWLGMITPIGGIFFLLGWLWLAIVALRIHRAAAQTAAKS